MTLSRNLHLDPATDDAALVAAVRKGDQAALEALLVRAQEIAYRFSRVICGAGAADAEDAMQDALVNVYRRASEIREPKAFRAWLYRTVKNACLIGRRRKVHEPGRLLSLDELTPGGEFPVPSGDRSPEQLAMDGRTRLRLRRALASLPPSFRTIVFLRDIEGLSTREVAQVMDISEDNVKTRLHRARLQLRKVLEDR
ncbi:MAG: sigma-70 family RNA polymerase sigma factor [Acidobacteria bacterium]|nr:sigma-70 family RNA polymerase sigma factor [Acidobacteriota bacterium]